MLTPSCSLGLTAQSAAPLVGLLRQLGTLVESLTDAEYSRKPVGVVTSSIGGHVRHNLDHIDALLRGLRVGEIDYDHRERGTAIETDRQEALAAISRLECEVDGFPWEEAPAELELTTLLAPDVPPLRVATNPSRELAFVVSHTIHHNALIGVMVKLLGRVPPADFGYAPSTVAHLRSQRCAR